MYYARPKKQYRLGETPVEIHSVEDERTAADYSSDEDGRIDVPLIKPVPYSDASTLHSRGTNQLFDKIGGVDTTKDNDTILYPVQPPGGLHKAELDSVLAWQEELAERKKRLKNHPMYQFAHLVAGNLHYQSLDPILEPITQWPSADYFIGGNGNPTQKSPQPEAERRAAALFQDPLGSGLMNFSPAFTAALHGSYADVESWMEGYISSKTNTRDAIRGKPIFKSNGAYEIKNRHLNITPKLEQIINTPGRLKTQFARLVSRNMLEASNLARDGYHLEVDYDRVMASRDKLLGNIVTLITGSKKRPYK